jgi:hypothetical protein
MAVWHAVMWVCTPVAVLILASGLYGLVDGLVALDGWQVVRALWVTAAGVSATVWCVHEWRHWREVSPTALRGHPAAGRG